ncbi:hypothetical protein C7K25_13605 [Gulosibacter molinativorax]|uniref:Uncharacterized protein n=1 Tax=Gulosibacter molinativorax TaxID=256821 RepID=A0ABT7CB85_9MICO|nr:hypothetical protein [Gulosibacter molinativorax]QUY61106.1 Hypotetical protein [Gulosibacter molinativorax]
MVVALVVAWLVVHFSATNTKAVAQEELIRAAVDDSDVVTGYTVLKVAEGKPGFTLEIHICEGAAPTSVGALMQSLYGEIESVAKVDLTFANEHKLNTTRLERSESQWGALIEHVTSAGPATASVNQVGPAEEATYWLNMTSFVADPATEYERIQTLERPEWLTHGTVDLATPPGSWPSLGISAGREVTSDELDTFRTLERELAASLKEGENYELKMHVELGGDAAEFEMRIITSPLSNGTGEPVPGDSANPTTEDLPSGEPEGKDERPNGSGPGSTGDDTAPGGSGTTPDATPQSPSNQGSDTPRTSATPDTGSTPNESVPNGGGQGGTTPDSGTSGGGNVGSGSSDGGGSNGGGTDAGTTNGGSGGGTTGGGTGGTSSPNGGSTNGPNTVAPDNEGTAPNSSGARPNFTPDKNNSPQNSTSESTGTTGSSTE